MPVAIVQRDPPTTLVAAPNRTPVLAAAGAGAVVAAAVFWVVHDGLIDDAYITLDYVRNVTAHLHWGLIASEEANSASSPLNVWLLSAATALVRLVTGELRPVAGLGVLTVAAGAVLGGYAARLARALDRSAAWSLLVIALVFANPFVNSAIGLEVLPIAALTTVLLTEAVLGRRVAFGITAGLLVLTRLDLGLVAAVVYGFAPEVRRRFWVAPAVAAIVALPWFVFSWAHFGSAIPDTFAIKTLQRSFGDRTFANGMWTLYLDRQHPLPLLLSAVPAGVGIGTAVVLLVRGIRGRLPRACWPLVGLAVAGCVYFGAYIAIQVPPYQWYYVPTTVSLALVGSMGLALALPRRLSIGVPRLVAALTALAVGALFLVTSGSRPLPWDRPVYFGNWALPAEYRTIGAEVGSIVGTATVLAPPEIGTLAYACECSMVDAFADRGRALPLITERLAQAGTVSHALLTLNFTHLDRMVQPRPASYQLIWTQGPVPPGVPAWPTSSPGTGDAVLYLVRLP